MSGGAARFVARGASWAAVVAAALIAGTEAEGSFRIRIPSGFRRGPGGAGAPSAAAAPVAFPEGRLEAAYCDGRKGAVFTRHSCGLQPHLALEAAARALEAAGWRRVFATASLALFEGASGKCAAVAAAPASGGGAEVSMLVQN